jgi:hypothetical protein
VLEGVAWHEQDAGRASRLEKVPGGACRGSHRLFDEHVLSGFDGLKSQRYMACWRCRDYDRVDMRQGILNAGIYSNALVDLWVLVTDPGKPLVNPDYRRHPGRGSEDPYMP